MSAHANAQDVRFSFLTLRQGSMLVMLGAGTRPWGTERCVRVGGVLVIAKWDAITDRDPQVWTREFINEATCRQFEKRCTPRLCSRLWRPTVAPGFVTWLSEPEALGA